MGAPVNFDQIYYPAPAHGKGEEETVQIGEAIKFEQGKIDMKEGLGIKVANKGCHCLDCWHLELILFLLVVGTIPLAVFI